MIIKIIKDHRHQVCRGDVFKPCQAVEHLPTKRENCCRVGCRYLNDHYDDRCIHFYLMMMMTMIAKIITNNISSDLVIWDPAATKTLGKEEQLSK